ncbi:MAG: DUF4395 domain-containing protein [Dermatophilaceae bacterium]
MALPRYPDVVDEVTVRLVAAAVLVVGALGLITGQWWWYAALALDFVARVSGGPALSPIARSVLRWVRPLVSAAPRPTAGPPKRFAAAIGAVLTTVGAVAAAAAWVTGSAASATTAFAVGSLMVVFPALEAVAGICVGCLVFARLMRAGVIPHDVCVACADITARNAPAPAR